jgi:hypothetical protein
VATLAKFGVPVNTPRPRAANSIRWKAHLGKDP